MLNHFCWKIKISCGSSTCYPFGTTKASQSINRRSFSNDASGNALAAARQRRQRALLPPEVVGCLGAKLKRFSSGNLWRFIVHPSFLVCKMLRFKLFQCGILWWFSDSHSHGFLRFHQWRYPSHRQRNRAVAVLQSSLVTVPLAKTWQNMYLRWPAFVLARHICANDDYRDDL